MRQALVNENSDICAENTKYIMRITGDNAEGKAQLDNFIAVDEKYPTIVTTSKLMTTGVDCKTCKLIVLDNNIESITEFKQIIGRGTRLKPDYGKEFFTIMDFKGVCRLFADPDFDGEPVPDEDFGTDNNENNGNMDTDNMDDIIGSDNNADGEDDDNGGKSKKVRINGVDVKIISERVQYYDVDGKLITESLTDYTKKNILKEFASLDEFLNAWNSQERKQAIIEELKERGVLLEALHEISGNQELDDFDLICHLAYDKKPLTKAERVNNVKKRDYLSKYEDVAREVLTALLGKYMNDGIYEIESTQILENEPFRQFGSAMKIAKLFGGKDGYLKAVRELEHEIYVA
jgi:type I restriction enzyme R subunit